MASSLQQITQLFPSPYSLFWLVWIIHTLLDSHAMRNLSMVDWKHSQDTSEDSHCWKLVQLLPCFHSTDSASCWWRIYSEVNFTNSQIRVSHCEVDSLYANVCAFIQIPTKIHVWRESDSNFGNNSNHQWAYSLF